MKRPEIDFEEIKRKLLYDQNIQTFISSKENRFKAVFIFWALEDIKRNQEKLNENEISRLKEIESFLENTKDNIFKNNLESSLQNYSDGFILGTLEYFTRVHEANIEYYSKYRRLVNKLEQWEEIGIPDDEIFQNYWKEAMTGIKEIQSWMESKSDEFFPVLARIINSGQYCNPTKILKALRKSGSENTIFQILSSILQTNPILYEKVTIHCVEKSIDLDTLRAQMKATLLLLEKDTTDPKVKNYCKLFLKRFKTKENVH